MLAFVVFYNSSEKDGVSQKEGNGGVHMGFALSDTSPKAFNIRKILHHKGRVL